MKLRVLVLGAGQDVGRSCTVVRMGGRTLMFDCGMHMGYNDHRRFPNFSLLSRSGHFTEALDALLVTHFHLDHAGALPYFTEVCGYHGPIIMTPPTRAITPLMLEDYWKVLAERPGSGPVYAAHQIAPSMRNVVTAELNETLQLDDDFEVTPFYAGHVLGAVMFHVRVGHHSLVYTGDYNTYAERHLGPAALPRGLRPDVIISEATYATAVRDGGRDARERKLLAAVTATVGAGGKVLIPVSAVGRAQELLLMLDETWEAQGLRVPIYFTGGMAQRANAYYALLAAWAAPALRGPGAARRAFGFGRVQPWEWGREAQPGACVVFATPGMLQGGASLELFRALAPDPANLVLLPSFQAGGTVGKQVAGGAKRGVRLDAATTLDVRCKVAYAPFSAHTDARGILETISAAGSACGGAGLPCYTPANEEEVEVAVATPLRALISDALLPTTAQPSPSGRPRGRHPGFGGGPCLLGEAEEDGEPAAAGPPSAAEEGDGTEEGEVAGSSDGGDREEGWRRERPPGGGGGGDASTSAAAASEATRATGAGTAALLDCVLVALPPLSGAEGGGGGRAGGSLQLLPARAAAEALGVRPHRVRLRCGLAVDASALRAAARAAGAPRVSAEGAGAEGVASDVAAVLTAGLPPQLAAEVRLAGCQVSMRSLHVQAECGEGVAESQPPPETQAAHQPQQQPQQQLEPGEVGSVESRECCLQCTWLYEDDLPAQQCLALLGRCSRVADRG